MSTNGDNGEDTEMAECEGEKVVTMMDVLQEQQEFEEDANAVLGASDDKNCTYSKGYIKRQAVYACLTCCNDAKNDPDKRAGVCLACSLTCHENHDLLELYTKRNFRCDCGNPKFNHPCQYTENKTSLNDENIYNQNFSGLYCTCHRPYPDPDGDEEEMIQCIVCEDWLHSSHLEATVPSPELYAEMICKACMEKNEFLHDYSKYAVNGDVDVVSISESEESKHCNRDTNETKGSVSPLTNEETDKIDTESGNDSDILTKIDNPTEAMDSTHDTIDIDQNNSKEQMHPNLPVTEKSDDEKTLTEKSDDEKTLTEKSDDEKTLTEKSDDEKTLTEKTDGVQAEPVKSSDENPMEKDLADDAANAIEENQVKDNQEDKLSSDKISDKLGNNADSAATSEEQENIDTTNDNQEDKLSSDEISDKLGNNVDSAVTYEDQENIDTTNGNEEDKLSSDEISDKLGGNADSAATSEDQENIDTTNNKGDNTTDVTEQQEDPADPSQVSNAGDANSDQPTEVKIDESFKVASQEKQNLADSSQVSADNTNVETLQVTNNNFGYEETNENKRKLSSEESSLDVSAKKPKLRESDCIRPQGERKMFKGATFWPCHFRQKLCTCNECITMYKDLSVLFLIDPEDTVTAYEVLGKEKTDGAASTQYEKGLEALSSLGRIQQINALTEYNKMRDKLLDFLKSFKDRKEVVKEEDIKAFFAGMKPKREPDGVYFCR